MRPISRLGRNARRIVLVALGFLPVSIFAQSNTGTIRGTVSDPSGSQVVGAQVTATSSTGQVVSTLSNAQGAYQLSGLAAGRWELKASAPSFAEFDKKDLAVAAGSAETVDIPLVIEVQHQQVEVSENAQTLEVSPDKNAGTVSLQGSDLDALSDDPDQLAQDLQTLAGPATGPNGGQVYVNGFTAGQLPPKSSIREIRVNQNPFAAEFDSVGFGRIEILTKPGSNKLHGDAFLWSNDQPWNSWNPFVPPNQHLGYYTLQEGGDLSGSLGKKTSLSGSYFRRFINQLELGAILDPNTFTTQLGALAVPNPRLHSNYGATLDRQVTAGNTLTVYYQYGDNSEQNDGIGTTSLPQTAFNSHASEHQLQITDNQILNPSLVNETRLQYLYDSTANTPESLGYAYSAPGTVSGGGNSAGVTRDTQNRWELQNYTTLVDRHHTIKFGARLRDTLDRSYSLANANGSFSFASAAAFEGAELALKQGQAVPVADYPISFTLGAGSPRESANLFDAGLFAQDDYQWRPNVTFSLGFRLETETGMPDHADYAPRVAVAWGIGKTKSGTPRSVVRAGWGIFYSRFPLGNLVNSLRFNGVTQVNYSVLNPDFFPRIPTAAEVSGFASLPTVYKIAPDLRAPYNLQAAATLEQQLFGGMSLTLSYIHAHGVHQFYTANINTPLAGTFQSADPTAATYPFGYSSGYIDQYQSEGIYRQNQLIVNFNGKAGKHLSLWSYYVLNYAKATTGGLLSDYYSPKLDYGRANFDVRNRAFIGGTLTLKYGVQMSPYIAYTSGQPFNITSGQNLFGTAPGGGNARPSSTTLPASSPGVYLTPWGNLSDGLPAPGETTIPINLATGPSQFFANMSLSKAFTFGPAPEAPSDSSSATPASTPAKKAPGRYSLRVGVYARNVFNQRNYANPVGVIGSSEFLRSVSLINQGPANRQVFLSAGFNF